MTSGRKAKSARHSFSQRDTSAAAAEATETPQTATNGTAGEVGTQAQPNGGTPTAGSSVKHSTPRGEASPATPARPKTVWSDVPNSFTFTIKHHTSLLPPNKKRKRGEAERFVQKSPFDPDKSTIYSVHPPDKWEDTNRYRKFTIANETFAVGDCVYIKFNETPDNNGNIPNWVGRVLEVRAGDEQHVYLRIYWLYRPEDLKDLKIQPGDYYGRNELIASNHMDILDAMTVNGRANVSQWREDNESELLDPDQLFWRQTVDVHAAGGPVLSAVRQHCVDQKPYNPDSLLINCSHCGIWLHAECIAKDAVKRAHETHDLPYVDPDAPATAEEEAAKAEGKTPQKAGGGKRGAGVNGTATPTSSKKTPKGKRGRPSGPAAAKDEPKVLFSAEVVPAGGESPEKSEEKAGGFTMQTKEEPSSDALGTPALDAETPAATTAGVVGANKIVVTDLRAEGKGKGNGKGKGEAKEGWEEEVKCLACGHVIV